MKNKKPVFYPVRCKEITTDGGHTTKWIIVDAGNYTIAGPYDKYAEAAADRDKANELRIWK